MQIFDIHSVYEKVAGFFIGHVNIILRTLLVLIAVALVLEAADIDALAIIEKTTGIDIRVSTSIFLVTLMIAMLDAQYGLAKRLIKASDVHISPTEAKAYSELSALIRSRPAGSIAYVDLIQLSGRTAIPLLTELADAHRGAKVRLLLLHRDITKNFDGDTYRHTRRVTQTIEDLKNLDLDVTIKFYRAYPAVCSAVINGQFLAACWYRSFHEADKSLRVRSHDFPAVVASGEQVQPLLMSLDAHFKTLWATAEDTQNGVRRFKSLG